MAQQHFSKKENVVQAVKFLLFSCSAGVIEFASFTFLKEVTHFPYWPAYLIALVLSVVWNFTLNRNFTFHSAVNIAPAMLKVFGYYAVFTPVSTLLGNYYADKVGINSYIVLFVTMVLNLITEFLFDRFFVFGNSIGTKKSKKKPAEK